jgi:aryl-alcohol dehydrogenase-like predicted oxidoreductase
MGSDAARRSGKAFAKFGFRDDIVLATKVNGAMGLGPNDRGLSRRHIRHAVEQSLRRLQTDYIDLYQMHRYDPTGPSTRPWRPRYSGP